jgi:hypothetical protein
MVSRSSLEERRIGTADRPRNMRREGGQSELGVDVASDVDHERCPHDRPDVCSGDEVQPSVGIATDLFHLRGGEGHVPKESGARVGKRRHTGRGRNRSERRRLLLSGVGRTALLADAGMIWT